jgi:hypothetical protein
MPHEIGDVAASRDRHSKDRGGGLESGRRPSALLEKVLANGALKGAQGTLIEGGQDGQLSLDETPHPTKPSWTEEGNWDEYSATL